VDFAAEDELADYRDQAREWIAEYVDPAWAQTQKKTGQYHTPALHRMLAEQGFYAAGWPKEYGGSDVSPDLARALLQELARTGVKHDGWSTTSLVLNTLLDVGTAQQKRTYISAGLSGEVVIALGYTEPGSGSDTAAARSRAVRSGDGWVINGQKMFTSTGDLASHIFMLTRTDTNVPKHKGLTMFLVPTTSPGFEWSPVHTMGGQITTATFYTDVRVPDSARVGEVDGGWAVMRAALVYERGGGIGARPPSGTSGNVGSQRGELVRQVASWSKRTRRADGTRVWDDPAVRERLGRIAMESEVYKVLWMRSSWIAAAGGAPGTEGSAAKLYMTEREQRHHWDLLDILGPEGVLARSADGAPLHAAVEEAFRYGVVGTVYGGSSEIMREIVAERQLGLPSIRRSRA
jgi:alkylation response protein AidB-like acyl-CoA dehydrogenase